jgi:hypothetical protein
MPTFHLLPGKKDIWSIIFRKQRRRKAGGKALRRLQWAFTLHVTANWIARNAASR